MYKKIYSDVLDLPVGLVILCFLLQPISGLSHHSTLQTKIAQVPCDSNYQWKWRKLLDESVAKWCHESITEDRFKSYLSDVNVKFCLERPTFKLYITAAPPGLSCAKLPKDTGVWP
ncbi:hypothetical protein C8J56DRAFT_898872 [Mycena floridula]|nr:hypothetical protein C8J56DRAFT_898872 [Mycena floridula]